MVSFDQREGYIWYNGEFVNWKDAKTHILNHGLHYASCVFEGEKIYNKKIFRSLDHSKRLFNSAQMLGFDIPIPIQELEQIKKDSLKKNGISDGYLRVFAWRGSEKMAISAIGNKIHLAVACWVWDSYYSNDAGSIGLKLKFAKYKRPSPETIPSKAKAAGLYMICTISKHEAEDNGYDDALMLDYRGYVAEATGANIFFVTKKNSLITPIPDCFLNGITRQTVIELARMRGVEVIERHIMPSELKDTQDAFLTGSAAEVTRINNIDNKYLYPNPHKITLNLINDYQNLVRK